MDVFEDSMSRIENLEVIHSSMATFVEHSKGSLVKLRELLSQLENNDEQPKLDEEEVEESYDESEYEMVEVETKSHKPRTVKKSVIKETSSPISGSLIENAEL